MPQMGQIGKKTVMEHKLEEFRLGRINKERALKEVTENVKGMVAQKFHTLNGLPIPRPFYTLSDDGTSVQFQDSLFNVFADNQNEHLYHDMDSRWDALEIGYSQMQKSFSLDINLEKEGQEYILNKEERKNLTPVRPVLNQYQKNTCFYCGLELHGKIHVDHVIPYQAILHNQIWNLVLSHDACNEDKLDFIPSVKFIDKLKQRNELMLKSDRFLKQLLEKQIGTI
jgi:ribosomal protein L30/L7E